MPSDATIVEVPRPPAGRLPFLRLLARVVSNPVGSWGEDFYDEPIVVYDDFGLQTVFVMDPELGCGHSDKSPLYDDVLGRAGGKGLLIAEGDDWRRQRRIAAPLFRAEAILSYRHQDGRHPAPAPLRKEAAKLETAGVDLGFSLSIPRRRRRCRCRRGGGRQGAGLWMPARSPPSICLASTARGGRLGNFRTAAWLSLKLSEPRPIGFAPLFARRAGRRLILDVERLGAGRLVVGVERDLLDLGLCLAQ